MIISTAYLIVMIIGLLTAVTGAAMLFVVVWQNPKHPNNQLMGFYMGLVAVWGMAVFAGHAAAVISLNPTWLVYLRGWLMFMTAPILFVLTVRYSRYAETSAARRRIWAAIGIGVLSAVPIFTGWALTDIQIAADGRTLFNMQPPGYILHLTIIGLLGGSAYLIYPEDPARTRYIFWGLITLMTGVLLNLLPLPIGRYPAPMLGALTASLLFTHIILRDNLFNPLARLNYELAQTNRQLSSVSREAQHSSASLRALIENTSDLIWSIDSRYRLIVMNSTSQAFFELIYESELREGQHILEPLDGLSRDDWRQLYDKALSGRRFSIERTYSLDERTSQFDLEISFTPIYTAEGVITGVSVFARDITRHKETERELKRQALTFDNISDSIIITDLEGNITDCNPATEDVFGYTKEFLLGKRAEIWHAPEEKNVLTRRILRGLEQDGRWEGDINFIRADGRRGICEALVLPLKDDDGETLALLGVSRDITERHRREEELREAKESAEAANKAKSAFLASMSHELRTPLNAIIGYGEVLEEDAIDQGLHRMVGDLQRITTAGRHLLSLINDVLDLSKIEAGKVSLYVERYHLPSDITEIALTNRSLLEKNGNELNMDIDNALGYVYGDATKIRQIVVNLLSNAAKFTHDGRVTLTAERGATEIDEDSIILRVADTGIGMKEATVAHIFDAFTQADASTTRRYGGTGLGLAICYHYCKLMYGRILVESEAGVGSTFTVELPADLRRHDPESSLYIARDKLTPPPDTTVMRVTAHNKGIVLIIDHDAHTRDLLVRQIYRDGYRVYTAGNGQMGIRLAQKLIPDIVIFNPDVPDMGGREVLEQIRAHPRLTAVPIILSSMTGDHQRGYAARLTAEQLAKSENGRLFKQLIHENKNDQWFSQENYLQQVNMLISNIQKQDEG